MSEMTVEMVIAALKASGECEEDSYLPWLDVLEWTDWATGVELQELAKGLTNYIFQRAPKWRSEADRFWIDADGLSIPLASNWRQFCYEDFIPLDGWALSAVEVRFAVEMLLEFDM